MEHYEQEGEAEAMRQLLEPTDTRPFFHGSADPSSTSDQILSVRGRHEKLPSLEELFGHWTVEVDKPGGWIKSRNISSMFRFALRRPLMSERMLHDVFTKMNLRHDVTVGGFQRTNTLPQRPLLLSIEDGGTRHISARLGDSLSLAVTRPPNQTRVQSRIPPDENIEGERPSTDQDSESDLDVLRLQQRLWDVYDDVQDGTIPLEEAPVCYADIRREEAPGGYDIDLDAPIDDAGLISYLQSWGIPSSHIPRPDDSPRLGTAVSPFRQSTSDGSSDVGRGTPHDKKQIRRLAKYVRVYRSSYRNAKEETVASMLQECLAGLRLELDEIIRLLDEYRLSPLDVAEELWESATYNKDAFQDIDISMAKMSETMITNRSLAGNFLVDEPSANTILASAPRHPSEEQNQTSGESTIKPDSLELTVEDKSNRLQQRPPQSTADAENAVEGSPTAYQPRSGRCVTPTPAGASPASTIAPATPKVSHRLDWEHFVNGAAGRPCDDSYDPRKLSRSPDNGLSDNLFGLPMPTKQARELGQKINLPEGYAEHRIRSRTPRRLSANSLCKASTNVVFHSSKRKHSSKFQGGSPPKQSKIYSNNDFFAAEGESQETFVRSHLTPTCTGASESPSCFYENATNTITANPAAEGETGVGFEQTLGEGVHKELTCPIVTRCKVPGQGSISDISQPKSSEHTAPLLQYLSNIMDDTTLNFTRF